MTDKKTKETRENISDNKTGRDRVKAAAARIADSIPEDRCLKDEPMSKHTSFRIGGPAALFVQVFTEDELAAVLQACATENAEHIIVGNGTNFLVADEGYPGIMIHLAGDFETVEETDDACCVRAGAAKLLSGISAFLTERGLAGFEFASGIPGSLGGAVFMNAGAYGGEIGDLVESVRLMKGDGSSITELPGSEMGFAYRHSSVEDSGMIVLSAVLRLIPDAPDAIAARVAELQAKRNAKQPVNYPSAGSTFKRPANGFAAALIDEAGLKGYRVGGAMVSEKHAGFVINAGGATAEDVLAVMRHVRDKVMQKSGIELEPEVRLINCSLQLKPEA
ncbi:MAG: UDP-N-acetylmuramate dehydrogenase [Mogibacterium sp.]|nr:UDP-N-acetylmuramate dehydrogenase [Mogibacterium sp.]